MRYLKHILIMIILLGTSFTAMSQYMIDVVCVGAERHYRIDGEAGSTYTWTLTDPLGNTATLASTADTVTILWDGIPGLYSLATTQFNPITSCSSLIELGQIRVVNTPEAFAGTDVSLCGPLPYTLAIADTSYSASVLWTTSGDGTFDDNTIIHPTYTFGPNDIINGSVTLTLTAQGLGYTGSCPPAVSAVTISLENLHVDTNPTPASCPVVVDGSVQLTASGGTEPYTYTIGAESNNTGFFGSLATGTYTYTVTDANGCEVTGSVFIDVLPALWADVTVVDEEFPGAGNGSLTVENPVGGSGNYEYQLESGSIIVRPWQSSNVFDMLIPGIYNVYIRDANAPDCFIWIGEFEITSEDALTAKYEAFPVDCYGDNTGSIVFSDPQNGSGVYEYSIDGGSSWQSSPVFPNLIAGTYILAIRDANNHDNYEVLDSIEVGTVAILYAEANFVPFDAISVINPSGGSGAYEYQLVESGTGVVVRPWQLSGNFSGLAPGSYDVMMRDLNTPTCELTITTIVIPEPEELIVTITPVHVSCFGLSTGEATANVAGGIPPYTFLWDDPLAQTTQTATGLAAGTYNVIVTDANGETATASVVISEPELLVVTVTGFGPTTAGGSDGFATAIVTGGTPPYTYLWNDPLAQTTQTATGLTAGTYTVTVTDANGCTTDETITLTDPGTELAVYIVIDNNVSCYGMSDGQATAVVTGGMLPYTYLWNDPLAQTTATASNLAPGTYTVTVTDSEGTIVTTQITITEPSQLALFVGGSNPTAVGAADGEATANASGGTPPYTYLWDDPLAQTTQTATGLTAGTYTVIVTDANGCTIQSTITLVDPDPSLQVFAYVIDNVACYGGNTGSASVQVIGGVAPYSYLWNDPLGQTTQTATGLAAGTYMVTVTDADGAFQTGFVTITQPDELLVTITPSNPTTIGGNDGSATANVTGGTPPYTYLWDDPSAQTTQTATGLTAGIYTVIVTDANGCTTQETVVLTDPGAALAVTAVVDANVDCFGGTNGQATAIASGGTPPYTYAWNDPLAQTTATATNLAAGTYTVTVTDAVGTITSTTVTITQPEVMYAQTTVVNIPCNGGTTGSIEFTNPSGGSGTYLYSIDNGTTWHTSPMFANLPEGTYQLMIADQATPSCIVSLGDETITQGTALALTFNPVPTKCNEPNGSFTVTATGGSGVYEYMIDGLTTWQSSNNFQSLLSAAYTVRVRDNSGCEQTAIVYIDAIAPVDITNVLVDPAHNNLPDGKIEIIAVSPAMPIVYSLDGITWQSSPIFTGLAGGTFYTAWAMDANGCIDTWQFNVGNVVLAEIEVRAGRVLACVGQIKSLDIIVANFDSIASFDIRLSYDPAVFEYVGPHSYHANLVQSLVQITLLSPGVIDISYTDPTFMSVPDWQSLLQLNFRGIAPGETMLTWHFISVIYNYSGYNMPKALVDGEAFVNENPNISVYNDAQYCEGDSTTIYAISHDDQVLSYTWKHPRGILHNGAEWHLTSLSTMDEGNYIMQAWNENCVAIDTVNIKVFKAPVLHIASADTICFGNPVVLSSNGTFRDYEWNTGSNMSSIYVSEPGIYWLKVVDFNGCMASDQVVMEPCLIEVLVPNAFTPNGDGLNDTFKPIFRGFEPTNYRMDIFSKWGQHIFSTGNLSEGWDGTINGHLVGNDTFTYVISYEVPSFVLRKGLSSPISGRVTVIR